MSDPTDDDVARPQDPDYVARFRRDYVPDEPAEAEPEAEPTPSTPGGVDPRFDPRFQRGYDPDRHDRARARIEEADPRPLLSSSFKPQQPLPRAVPASADPVPENRAEPLPPVDETVGKPAVEPVVRARNPFLVALWIVGFALVAAGIGFTLGAANDAVGRLVSPQADDFGTRVAWSLAPVLLQAGIVTIVALVLRLALLGARASRGARTPASGETDERP